MWDITAWQRTVPIRQAAASGAPRAASQAGVPSGEGRAEAAEAGSADRIDFTRISPRQLGRVVSALVESGRVGAQTLAGATDLVQSRADVDTPLNMIAYLSHEAEANASAPGGLGMAFRQRAALTAMMGLQRDAGLPIVYDDRYPTAPQGRPTEDSSAKLKAAVAAFRAEAALTPAQRLAKKLRADIMREMKVGESDLKAMAPDARAALERRIDEEVARRMATLGFGGGDGKAAASPQADAAAYAASAGPDGAADPAGGVSERPSPPAA